MQYQLCLDMSWQLQQQHGDAKGYITLAKNESNYKWSQKYYQSQNLPVEISGTDIYCSQNTFLFPVRKTVYVKQLRSLYIDIDCYKVGLTHEQVLGQLEQDFYNVVFPVPNFVILSGRGLALVWHIKPAPADALPLWQFTQDWLYKQLEYLGADSAATDAARVLRLAGTINSKNGATVQILDCHSHKLDLKDWKRDWLPEKKVKPEKRVFKGKITKLFNTYSLHFERMSDIKTIIDLRSGRCNGHRELILFLYRYYSLLYLKDSKEALERVLQLNKRFRDPLPWREVFHNTRSAETAVARGKQYNYTNKSLIKLLDITSEEQRRLKTIIGTEEKYRRNNERREKARRDVGQTTREKYLNEQEKVTQGHIMTLKTIVKEKPYLTQKEIAEILKISIRHLRRLQSKLSDN